MTVRGDHRGVDRHDGREEDTADDARTEGEVRGAEEGVASAAVRKGGAEKEGGGGKDNQIPGQNDSRVQVRRMSITYKVRNGLVGEFVFYPNRSPGSYFVMCRSFV